MTMRRLLGGVLVVLLVSGVACKQSSSVQTPAQTVSTDTPEIAALRVKANTGDADSQWSLGNAYANGRGAPQDYAQAVAWYRKAAEQGDANAQHDLGLMYADGQGVPQDYVEAHKWLNLAASRAPARLGISASITDQKLYANIRDEEAQTMTPPQIEAAQKLAREWLAAFEKRGGK